MIGGDQVLGDHAERLEHGDLRVCLAAVQLPGKNVADLPWMCSSGITPVPIARRISPPRASALGR